MPLSEKIKQTEELLKTYMSLPAKSEEDPEAGGEKKKIREALRRSCSELVEAAGFASAPSRNADAFDEKVRSMIAHYFQTMQPARLGRVSEGDIEKILARLCERGALSDKSARHIVFNGNPGGPFLLNVFTKEDAQLRKTVQLLKKVHEKSGLNTRKLIRSATAGYEGYAEGAILRISRAYETIDILQLLSENEAFRKAAQKYIRSEKERNRVKNGLLDAIPPTYPELFPLARRSRRRFILHIGPTNSGKSYDAINALKEAENGIYLAPLRLLAYEKFEELNDADCPCTLKTGEEEIGIPFSYLQSSTIEVLDFTKEYDVAVIDEAQMIADSQRGSAWTFALLGVRAKTVHVCLAPEAEDVVKSVITSCGDTWEVVRHERLVPLVFDGRVSPDFKKEAKRGTAFIVFSRKDVHAVAGELQKSGVRCSVIYGALPYDVRRSEVKRYVAGETDVVVATDAIGMGLNLPIERVIFLETEKFDGTGRRPLTDTEIKQIGGRAGRYGMFPKGYVGTSDHRSEVKAAIYADVPQIQSARIGFPYTLTGIEGSISQLMSKWCEIEPKPGFENADLSIEISLAEELEKQTSDKDLIYRFVMIPFDEKNVDLKDLWLQLFRDELAGKGDRCLDYLPPAPRGREPLERLETNFKACDMLYHYIEAFTAGREDDLRTVLMRKNEISARIMELLSRQRLSMKRCKVCGRELPFHYKFGVCEDCFAKGRRPHAASRYHRR